MNIKVYKVSISLALYGEIGMKATQFSSKQAAIEALEGALHKHNKEFSREDDGDLVKYKNPAGGELARITHC